MVISMSPVQVVQVRGGPGPRVGDITAPDRVRGTATMAVDAEPRAQVGGVSSGASSSTSGNWLYSSPVTGFVRR